MPHLFGQSSTPAAPKDPSQTPFNPQEGLSKIPIQKKPSSSRPAGDRLFSGDIIPDPMPRPAMPPLNQKNQPSPYDQKTQQTPIPPAPVIYPNQQTPAKPLIPPPIQPHDMGSDKELLPGSSIRTMKTDMEELFRTGRPSIAQMVGTAGGPLTIVKKQQRIAAAYIALGILTLLVAAAGWGVFRYRAYLLPLIITPASTPAPGPVALPPFFATESTRTISVDPAFRAQFLGLMADAMKDVERQGTMKGLVIKVKHTEGEKFATMPDIFDLYKIIPPQFFLGRLQPDFMAFVYTGKDGTRFGMLTRTKDMQRTLRDMLNWETNMFNSFKPLFFGKALNPLIPIFEDRTYRNIDWRYLRLSPTQDIGLGYGIFPSANALIIATSQSSMETVINRLFDVK